MASKPKKVPLKIVRLAHGADLPLPSYQTAGAAGLDLVAALADGKPVMLKPGERALIPTGLCLEIPHGFEAQVRPRSGLALKNGLTVLNTPGTIDSDYRGELQVILINLGNKRQKIIRGERIAQLVIAPVVQASITVVSELKQSKRGAGGFGSTGTAASRSKTAKSETHRATPKSKPSRRSKTK